MTALRLDDFSHYSDILRTRSGEALTLRFLEPRDAGDLRQYFRTLSVEFALQPFLRSAARIAGCPARPFHPRRRA